MFCCVGLIGGMAVGQSLGGPWTLIAPAAGFGIGFVADMKLMKGMHKKGDQRDAESQAEEVTEPPRRPEAEGSTVQRQVPHMTP